MIFESFELIFKLGGLASCREWACPEQFPRAAAFSSLAAILVVPGYSVFEIASRADVEFSG